MKKGSEKQRGITLIALVITIIVMLILVGVSVTVALNGGLFDTAQKASNETKIERDEEQALAGGVVNVAGKEYNIMEEYGNKKSEAKKITFSYGNYSNEYTAREGETWAEWIAKNPSEGLYIDNEGVVSPGEGAYLACVNNLSKKIYGIDIIEDGQHYEDVI